MKTIKTAKQLATNEMACTGKDLRVMLGGLMKAEGTRDSNILFLQNKTIENKKFSQVSNKELPDKLAHELNTTLATECFSNIVSDETLKSDRTGYKCQIKDLDTDKVVKKEILALKNGDAIWEHIQGVRATFRKFRNKRLNDWRKHADKLEATEAGTNKEKADKVMRNFMERLQYLLLDDTHSASILLKLMNKFGKDGEAQEVYINACNEFLNTLEDSGKFKESEK